MTSEKDRSLYSDFITRNYRTIVFGLVLVNTALIVFLVVYIWTYGLDSRNTRSLGANGSSAEKNGRPYITSTVVVGQLVLWNKAGGMMRGGQSLGAVGKGKLLKVLGSVEVDNEIWLEVECDNLKGWVVSSGVTYE